MTSALRPLAIARGMMERKEGVWSLQLPWDFKYEEFMCKCGHCDGHIPEKYFLYLRDVLVILQTVRSIINEPIIVTSAYRCPYHPLTKLRPGSWHARAAAADIRPWRGGISKLVKYVEQHPLVGGIGYYPEMGIIHVDVRSSPARWVCVRGEYHSLLV